MRVLFFFSERILKEGPRVWQIDIVIENETFYIIASMQGHKIEWKTVKF